MGDTNIAWTNKTWNPVRGCERVSPGCVKCYAEILAARHSYPGGWGEGLAEWVTRPDGAKEARWTGVIQTIDDKLEEPLHWKQPARVFVNSMSDLFHDRVPDTFIAKVFAVMDRCERHTFQILTKRPKRMLEFCSRLMANPLSNVWLGVSAENQKEFDDRVEILGQVPAAIRFASCEPLLDEIDVGNAFDDAPEESKYQPLDWAIVGGETGQGYRPMSIGAARWLIQQCKLSGKPIFVKQDHGSRPGLQGRFTDTEWALKEYPK